MQCVENHGAVCTFAADLSGPEEEFEAFLKAVQNDETLKLSDFAMRKNLFDNLFILFAGKGKEEKAMNLKVKIESEIQKSSVFIMTM